MNTLIFTLNFKTLAVKLSVKNDVYVVGLFKLRKGWIQCSSEQDRHDADTCQVQCTEVLDLSRIRRAGPGVSPASPLARATPHPRATNWETKNL